MTATSRRNPMRIPAAFVFFLMLGTPVFAGEAYTFVLQSRGDLLEISRKGRVLVDGDRYRVQLDEPGDPSFPYDVLLSTDGGLTETGLFPDRRTYYPLKAPWRGYHSSTFGLFPTLGKTSLKDIQVTVVEAPEAEVVGGLSTRRKEIHLSYDISIPLDVRGRVTMDAVYWLVETPERTVPTLLRPRIATGFDQLDQRLREPLSRMRGFPVRQRVTVTIEGKELPRQVSSFTVDLTTPESIAPPAGSFEAPKGFRFEEPEISVPILGSR
jgi:hypothetical protein